MYGFETNADLRAEGMEKYDFGVSFKVRSHKRFVGRFRINLPGTHNVANALAAIGVGMELGIPSKDIRSALEDFRGVHRRIEYIGEVKGIRVFDDYGHHPTELAITLQTLRDYFPNQRIVSVFQPHRYTRTLLCFEDFLGAFHDADSVIVTDIYPAGEKELTGVNAERLAEGIRKQGHKEVHHMQGFSEIVSHLVEVCHEGDMVVTLGAGDVYRVGEMLLKDLQHRD